MYLLYLDDSGSPKNRQENHFVLGGVCIHQRKNYYINRYLGELAENIDPDNPTLIEFHAAEIFAGRRGVWSTINDKQKRIQIIKDVLNVLNVEVSDTCAFACAVHKPSNPGLDPVELAFEDLISRFSLFLKRKHMESGEREHGLIILDKSTYETNLQNLIPEFKSIGTRWGTYINFIDEVPLFVDSKASRTVQLADHIAYAVYRRYEQYDLKYIDVIQGKFDHDGDKLHGLEHKQKAQGCWCPSCLSKNANY